VTLVGTAVTAHVQCAGDGHTSTLLATWQLYGGSATASVQGEADGVSFTGTMSAP
jgi:hypothetical protein